MFLRVWSALGAKSTWFYVSGAPRGAKCKCVYVSGAPPGANVCVSFFCESAPGVPKVLYFTMSGAPGERQKGKNIYCCGSPHPKKSDVRSRYVCVFVHVLMAKTTIGKSMCVFMSIRVCVCVQSVYVFVCNPCVCLWPIFHRKLRGLGACLKHCKGGHFRRVFTK